MKATEYWFNSAQFITSVCKTAVCNHFMLYKVVQIFKLVFQSPCWQLNVIQHLKKIRSFRVNFKFSNLGIKWLNLTCCVYQPGAPQAFLLITLTTEFRFLKRAVNTSRRLDAICLNCLILYRNPKPSVIISTPPLRMCRAGPTTLSYDRPSVMMIHTFRLLLRRKR